VSCHPSAKLLAAARSGGGRSPGAARVRGLRGRTRGRRTADGGLSPTNRPRSDTDRISGPLRSGPFHLQNASGRRPSRAGLLGIKAEEWGGILSYQRVLSINWRGALCGRPVINPVERGRPQGAPLRFEARVRGRRCACRVGKGAAAASVQGTTLHAFAHPTSKGATPLTRAAVGSSRGVLLPIVMWGKIRRISLRSVLGFGSRRQKQGVWPGFWRSSCPPSR
jgi:hypothetical protein